MTTVGATLVVARIPVEGLLPLNSFKRNGGGKPPPYGKQEPYP